MSKKFKIVDAVEQYLQHQTILNFSEKTIKIRRYHLDMFTAWTDGRSLDTVDELTESLLFSFQSHLHHFTKKSGETLAIGTQRSAISTMRGMFEWLHGRGELQDNPAKGVKLPKADKTHKIANRGLSADEIESLFSVPDLDCPLGIRDRTILQTLLSTGMRRAEIALLDYNDVYLDEGVIHVLNGKGGVERIVYFGDEAKKWLKLYYNDVRPKLANQNSGRRFFLSNRGKPMGAETFGVLVCKIFKKAGIDRYGAAHMLRHSFTHKVLASGVNVASVQKMLGHKDLTTTTRYAQIHDSSVQDEYLNKVVGL